LALAKARFGKRKRDPGFAKARFGVRKRVGNCESEFWESQAKRSFVFAKGANKKTLRYFFRLFTFLLDKNGQLNYNIDITEPKAWIT